MSVFQSHLHLTQQAAKKYNLESHNRIPTLICIKPLWCWILPQSLIAQTQDNTSLVALTLASRKLCVSLSQEWQQASTIHGAAGADGRRAKLCADPVCATDPLLKTAGASSSTSRGYGDVGQTQRNIDIHLVHTCRAEDQTPASIHRNQTRL